MTQVVSFVDYTPAPRFDGEPWTEVDIEEAVTNTGAWVALETIPLVPVDADPANPATRSFTTQLANDGELWYRLIFRDADGDHQQATLPVQNRSAATLYVTQDELKEILHIQEESYADDAIDIAIQAASRMCDAYKQTRFYPTQEVRIYSPRYGDTQLYVDDLVSATAVYVDLDGSGDFGTQWFENTDFYLNAANAGLEERPSTMLVLRRQARRQFPRYERGLRIQGTFGWATTPAVVKQAAILLANRYLTRTRAAPLGVLVATTNEAVTSARLGRIDADVAELLDHLPGTQHGSLTSVGLG